MNETFKCKSEKDFIKGSDLNRGFYFDIVKPIIDKQYPNLKYSAALIGHCSDVLGFDDYKSTDHVWGPRLQIFLQEDDFYIMKDKLDILFKYKLPFEYKGFPTNYKAVEGWFNNAYMEKTNQYPINHFIEIETVDNFFNRDIYLDKALNIKFEEWLAFPIQNLLELTSGEVFYDGSYELTKTRQAISFFPKEVLLLRLFILWKSINEEQAFIGRCAERGDRIGESIITNRIIGKLMKVCFYYERKYYTYSKWFGRSFKNLASYKIMQPLIDEVINSNKRDDREKALNDFYIEVIKKHNELGLTDYIEPKIINYYDRGYLGFDSEVILKALEENIDWTKIKNLELLSKIELFDDSYFGCNYEINKKIVDQCILK